MPWEPSQGHGRAIHARLPGALAELQSGWELFLEFALEVGAIAMAEREELEERSENAFALLCALQATYQATSDPAMRFMVLLKAALTSGGAHVADRRGKVPDDAAVWGWQRKPKPNGRWTTRGTRIGWVSRGDLFLDPAASYQVAQELPGSERLVGEQTLRHRLRESGLLASVDTGRQMVQSHLRVNVRACRR